MKKELRKRPWKINYVVEYRDQAVADGLRTPIRTMLEVVSFLRGIDFLLSENHPFEPVEGFSLEKLAKNGPADVFHFRPKPDSTMTSKEFRTLMGTIFAGRNWGDCLNDFAVFPKISQDSAPLPK